MHVTSVRTWTGLARSGLYFGGEEPITLPLWRRFRVATLRVAPKSSRILAESPVPYLPPARARTRARNRDPRARPGPGWLDFPVPIAIPLNALTPFPPRLAIPSVLGFAVAFGTSAGRGTAHLRPLLRRSEWSL